MQYKNIVDIMVQVKGKGMKWWNWEERKAVTNHVTINRKMSNGDSLGTWRIPITHLKDTHQIPLRYPIVYWPIAPSRSNIWSWWRAAFLLVQNLRMSLRLGWESLSLFMGAIRQEVRKLLPWSKKSIIWLKITNSKVCLLGIHIVSFGLLMDIF